MQFRLLLTRLIIKHQLKKEKMKKYHIVPSEKGWNLKKEGAERASKSFETKQSALEYSKDYMRENGGSLKIHKSNGQIQEERTYPRKDDPKESVG